MSAYWPDLLAGGERIREPQPDTRIREPEAGRHDADDRSRLPAEEQGLPHEGGIRAQLAPEEIAEDGDAGRAGTSSPFRNRGPRAATRPSTVKSSEDVAIAGTNLVGPPGTFDGDVRGRTAATPEKPFH